MNYTTGKKALLVFFCLSAIPFTYATQAPKLTVIIIIDQFSAHFIPKLRPYLSGGLRFLSDEGTSYVNAFFDQCPPATGPGHALLASGTYASLHGIVHNTWFSLDGKKVKCDDDTAENAAVFAPGGELYPFGKSPANMLVDTLSDQLMLHSYPHAHNNVWALSIKSRAAIATAGRLGKAVWFDKLSGNFTSSKAYFDAIPEWINDFNEKHAIGQLKEITWNPFFDEASPAYRFNGMNTYPYTTFGETILDKPLQTTFDQGKDKLFALTPHANQLLLDLAYECIQKNYTDKESDRLVLWVSMSPLDKVGHIFGPHSKEAIDMVYQIDNQLKEFFDKIYSSINEEDVLFVLTADHAGQPIPEVLADQGLTLAVRYHYPQIIEHMNKLIEKKHSIRNIIQNFREPQFYLDQATLETLSYETKEAISQDIKDYLTSLPGIRRAWTFGELKNEVFEDYDLDRYLQRQLFKDRSGQILFSVNPYTTLFAYEPEGTKGMYHATQYAFDTHVPLIFYQKGRFGKKRITDNVFIPQVPVSLATLFEVPRPSAATANVLPSLAV